MRPLRSTAICAMLLPMVLNACSGGSGGIMPGASSASVGRHPATGAQHQSAAPVVVADASAFPGLRAAIAAKPPNPWTPVSQLGVVTLPNRAGQANAAGIRPPGAIKAMLKSDPFGRGNSNAVAPMSIVSAYNAGGTEGFVLSPGFDDTTAILTAYSINQVPVPSPPAGSSYFNTLATTMHAGQQPMDGTTNCLEIATVYHAAYGQAPEADLEVGDWCKQQGNEIFPYSYNLDDPTFQSEYIRNLSNGLPDVEVTLYQPLGGDGSWHAAIYNFAASQWDDLYHTYGSAGYDPTLQTSWDVIESHYYPGPCPVIPEMGSFDFQGAVETGNDQQNYWRTIQPGDISPQPIDNSKGADCFSDDGSGIGGVYDYSVTNPDSAWQVTDPAPRPKPTPIHSPFPNPCWGAVATRKSNVSPQICIR